jgi:hypothetical protein
LEITVEELVRCFLFEFGEDRTLRPGEELQRGLTPRFPLSPRRFLRFSYLKAENTSPLRL